MHHQLTIMDFSGSEIAKSDRPRVQFPFERLSVEGEHFNLSPVKLKAKQPWAFLLQIESRYRVHIHIHYMIEY
ncbi:hypothetical protein M8J75_008061 [Diaphorina citri]|nr:hypothetical protein M8J75_008061 [Diaphorina citri]